MSAGDTVNTASRMESLSFPMCVQVSAAMACQWQEGDKGDALVELGERDVKGKGRMTTYLLKVRRQRSRVQTLVGAEWTLLICDVAGPSVYRRSGRVCGAA